MKTIKITITGILLLITSITFSQIKSDKITPPSKGKSVIYFIRTSGLGALMNFRYFDGDKYLGRFNGVNYLRYECSPGEKKFWIKAENVDVLKANLKANKIYLVETNASMGVFAATAKFKLVDYNKKSQVKRINRLFKKKDGKTFSNKELKKQFDKMQKAFKKGLKKVNSKIKKGKFKEITKEMSLK